MKQYTDYELDLLTTPFVDEWDSDRFEDIITRFFYAAINPIPTKDSIQKHNMSSVSIDEVSRISKFGGCVPYNSAFRDVKPYLLADFLGNLPGYNGKAIDYIPKRASLSFVSKEGDLNYLGSSELGYESEILLTNLYIEKGCPKYVDTLDYNPSQVYKYYLSMHFANGKTEYLKEAFAIGSNLTPVLLGSTFDKGKEFSFDDEIEKSKREQSITTLLCNWMERKLSPRFYTTATESSTKFRFSVSPDQAKSLFYARSLQPTKTGRQKPILHWVQAHRRRMKSGIEVNISDYLRGVESFDLFGTKMEIISPQKAIRVNDISNFKGFQRY